MDYITKFYKQKSEELSEKAFILEQKLNYLIERAKRMDPLEFSAYAAEAGGEYKKDSGSGYLQSVYEPDYTMNTRNANFRPSMDPTEFSARAAEAGGNYKKGQGGYVQSVFEPNYSEAPARAQPRTSADQDMISRTMSMPGSVARQTFSPGTLGGNAPSLSAVRPSANTPEARKDLEQRAMGMGKYAPSAQASAPAASPMAPSPVRIQTGAPATSQVPPPAWIPTSLFATPPSGQYTPTNTSLATSNPDIGAPVASSDISIDPNRNKVMNQVMPVAKDTLRPPVADVVNPRSSVVNPSFRKPPAQAPVPAGEDFSEFWKKKGHGQARLHTDKELEEMMFRNKRSNMFGPAIPDEKQSVEYRAAKAELMKRGKLK
jgi:hypothetical protein